MRGWNGEEIRPAVGDILARLITTIVPAKGRISLQVVALRFIACTFLLNRIGNESLTTLAGRCVLSKQPLDFHAITIADRLGFHGFAQKRSEARAVYSQVQRESWAKLTPEERKARCVHQKNLSVVGAYVRPANGLRLIGSTSRAFKKPGLPRPARPLIYKGGRGTRSLGGSSWDEVGRDRDEGRDQAACLNSISLKGLMDE